tara:strand:- start:28 stop:603 length:576 start_codon:yes stop_codon:yes gene_type:complete
MGLDQRIGERFLRAGPPYGGSCFPKDTKAIVSISKKFKTNLTIIKSTIKSNEKRIFHILNKVKLILKNKIKNKKITILGVTFKPNTDDMRESSSLKIIPFFSNKGAIVRYFDPTGEKKEFKKYKNVKFCNSIKRASFKSDLIIIHTEWNEFKSLNFKKLINKKNFSIYDLRNIYSLGKMKKLKIKYFGVGR